jgi:hypothetical protein
MPENPICSTRYTIKHLNKITFIFGILVCDDIINKGYILLSRQLILVGKFYKMHM